MLRFHYISQERGVIEIGKKIEAIKSGATKIAPYLAILADEAIDYYEAKKAYNDSVGFQKQTEVDDVFAKRVESKKAEKAIQNLSYKDLTSYDIPQSHIEYLLKKNSGLIDSKHVSTLIDVLVVETMSNLVHDQEINYMALLALYYSLYKESFKVKDKVDKVDVHLSLCALAEVIHNPLQVEFKTALELICPIDSYRIEDMFEEGIKLNMFCKNIKEEINYKQQLISYLRGQNVAEADIPNLIDKLYSMIPETIKSSVENKYEVIYKYAPLYFAEEGK